MVLALNELIVSISWFMVLVFMVHGIGYFCRGLIWVGTLNELTDLAGWAEPNELTHPARSTAPIRGGIPRET